MYMAKLGDFVFSLDTAAFQTLDRSAGYRWAKQERIGSMPSLQFTGRDPETFTLAGSIFPHFRGGLGQMGTIRAMAGDGAPYDLVMTAESVGDYLGLYVIESVRETRTIFFDNGAPRKIDFTITLTEYGE